MVQHYDPYMPMSGCQFRQEWVSEQNVWSNVALHYGGPFRCPTPKKPKSQLLSHRRARLFQTMGRLVGVQAWKAREALTVKTAGQGAVADDALTIVMRGIDREDKAAA
jgi:hypothetical protein